MIALAESRESKVSLVEHALLRLVPRNSVVRGRSAIFKVSSKALGGSSRTSSAVRAVSDAPVLSSYLYSVLDARVFIVILTNPYIANPFAIQFGGPSLDIPSFKAINLVSGCFRDKADSSSIGMSEATSSVRTCGVRG